MSEALPAVLERMLALWNGEAVDPRVVYADPCGRAGGAAFSPEDAAADVRRMRRAAPDMRFTAKEWFHAGDRWVLRLSAAGTTPTGRAVRLDGVEVLEVGDDRVTRVWLGWDRAPLAHAAVEGREEPTGEID